MDGDRNTLLMMRPNSHEWRMTIDNLVGQRLWTNLWQLTRHAPAAWSLPDGKLLRVVRVRRGQRLRVPIVSPDGTMLITRGEDTRVWRFPEGQQLWTLEGHLREAKTVRGRGETFHGEIGDLKQSIEWHESNTIVVSPNGELAASRSWGSGKTVFVRRLSDGTEMTAFEESLTGMLFGPESRTLVLASSSDIRVYTLPEAICQYTLEGGAFQVRGDESGCLMACQSHTGVLSLLDWTWDRLLRSPLNRLTDPDCWWVKQSLADSTLDETGRSWLMFLMCLIEYAHSCHQ